MNHFAIHSPRFNIFINGTNITLKSYVDNTSPFIALPSLRFFDMKAQRINYNCIVNTKTCKYKRTYHKKQQ